MATSGVGSDETDHRICSSNLEFAPEGHYIERGLKGGVVDCIWINAGDKMLGIHAGKIIEPRVPPHLVSKPQRLGC